MPDTAYIMGAFEHPVRLAPDMSTAQIHAESARSAIADAGLSFHDVDGYFCAGDAPGLGGLSMIDYMGLRNVRHIDSTETGGSSYLLHVSHAAQAIAAGKCSVALITLAGRPRQMSGNYGADPAGSPPEAAFEEPYGSGAIGSYGMCAMRHMYEHGTTSEQLAWIKVAASHHAQWNPHALLRDVVTVEQVLASRLVADPLRVMDCCVVTDGGGALIVTSRGVADRLGRPKVKLKGAGEASRGPSGGVGIDLTRSATLRSGAEAFDQAGIARSDVKYVSIYDSFTITVLIQLEDLGFCEKGRGGAFVADGNLISGVGKLPFNTDGGGLCNNHPSNRGGMTKVIEAVRQLRGEAHPKVQVSNCDLALVQGTGGLLGARHASATLILERES